MVGQITSVYFLILSDSAAHLSEEVKNAAKSVPRAMIWSFVLNGTVGFIVLIAFLFSLPDFDSLDPEKNPSGFVFLYLFQQCSYKGSIILTAIMILVIVAGIIDSNASTSRQIFAFARDGGLPFQNWLSKVCFCFILYRDHPKRAQVHDETVPRNAVLVTCTFSILLSLINLGSTVAFNAIISLQLLALMATYCISIGCVFYQRLVSSLIRQY
jgi:choline transport protein